MVYLHRIYTRTGDEGETALGDGSRVPKDHCRIVAYGTVDELNSSLGVVVAGGLLAPLAGQLERIQHDLFDVGADLCVPQPAEEQPGARLRVDAVAVTRLEQWIDEATAELAPLESFILPGGSPQAAGLHMARTICRRAEIEVLRLARGEAINPQVLVYLNRLSDFLFVAARMANDSGRADVLWQSGGAAASTEKRQDRTGAEPGTGSR